MELVRYGEMAAEPSERIDIKPSHFESDGSVHVNGSSLGDHFFTFYASIADGGHIEIVFSLTEVQNLLKHALTKP